MQDKVTRAINQLSVVTPCYKLVYTQTSASVLSHLSLNMGLWLLNRNPMHNQIKIQLEEDNH